MDTSRPGPLMMLGGGFLMVIATALDWRGGSSGLTTDAMGLFGIFVALSGLMIGAVGGIRAFRAQLALPDEVLGFRIEHLCLLTAFTAFIWTFALISADAVDFGVHLTWLSAGVAGAGCVLELLADPDQINRGRHW